MFAIVIYDEESTDTHRVVTVLNRHYETAEQAHAAGQALMDRLESAIDDYTQVFTYDVVPARDPDKIEAHAISMINLFATADNRDYSITAFIQDEAIQGRQEYYAELANDNPQGYIAGQEPWANDA